MQMHQTSVPYYPLVFGSYVKAETVLVSNEISAKKF